MVQYQIQYKPIHPKTLSPITNETLSAYKQDVASAVSSEKDPKYDMFFYCDTPSGAGVGASKDVMKRVEGSTWVVHSVQQSLKGATSVARKLVQTYGIDKVQICKITPIATEIVFEER